MTKRRTVLAAAFALTVLGGGIAASGVAQAHRPAPAKATTSTAVAYTTPACVNGKATYGGGACPTTTSVRTKNAALPTTTTMRTKNRVITVPSAAPRTKNAALTTTTAVPKPVTTPVPSLPRTATSRVPTSNTIKN